MRGAKARLFLAVIELMESGMPRGAKLMPVHRTAPHVDERYALTQDEYDTLLRKYLPNGPDGPLTGLPRKEKRRVALLRYVSGSFRRGRKYKEREVNDILKRFMKDEYISLRKYLIDYSFLSRESDGSGYWLNV